MSLFAALFAPGPPSWAECRKRRTIYAISWGMAALLAFAAVLLPLPFQPPFFLVVIGALLTTSVLGIYLAGWRCPRCNDYFHYRFSLVDCFRRSCAHCGLALYTPIYSGFCHRCGYDLCANASGQSPECGQETGKGKNQFDRREDRTP